MPKQVQYPGPQLRSHWCSQRQSLSPAFIVAESGGQLPSNRRLFYLPQCHQEDLVRTRPRCIGAVRVEFSIVHTLSKEGGGILIDFAGAFAR